MSRVPLVLVLLPVLAVAAQVPKALKVDPVSQYEGVWECVSVDVGDGAVGQPPGLQVTIDGGRMTARTSEGDGVSTLRFDFTASPARMLTTGTVPAPGNVYPSCASVVKVEGGRLYWCKSHSADEYPAEFKGKKHTAGGSVVACFVFERVPDPKK